MAKESLEAYAEGIFDETILDKKGMGLLDYFSAFHGRRPKPTREGIRIFLDLMIDACMYLQSDEVESLNYNDIVHEDPFRTDVQGNIQMVHISDRLPSFFLENLQDFFGTLAEDLVSLQSLIDQHAENRDYIPSRNYYNVYRMMLNSEGHIDWEENLQRQILNLEQSLKLSIQEKKDLEREILSLRATSRNKIAQIRFAWKTSLEFYSKQSKQIRELKSRIRQLRNMSYSRKPHPKKPKTRY